MLLVDHQIRKLCQEENLLTPWSEATSGNGIISYGITSGGYDLRLANTVFIFKGTHGLPIDPKKFKDPEYCEKIFDVVTYPDHHPVIIPAHSYVLGASLEYIQMPRNLKGRCVGKSTYARAAVIINTTPLEMMWRGHLTIEISNPTAYPLTIYTSEGIAQLEFETLAGDCECSYADKNGKYQGQTGVTVSRVL